MPNKQLELYLLGKGSSPLDLGAKTREQGQNSFEASLVLIPINLPHALHLPEERARVEPKPSLHRKLS